MSHAKLPSPRAAASPPEAPGAEKLDAPSPALRALLEEVASEAPPAVDWERLERRLEAALDAEAFPKTPTPASPTPPSRRPRLFALGGLAAAAALGGLLLRGALSPEASEPEATATASPPAASEAPSPSPELVRAPDPAALRAGVTLEAGAEALSRNLGFARLELAPGSRLRVETLSPEDERAVLALERGRVEAEVNPPAAGKGGEGAPSRLVIEAGEARVAVRGTIFSVERRAERVLVEVRRGAVSVGPRARPEASELLRGPSRGVFTLAGAPLVAPEADAGPGAEAPGPDAGGHAGGAAPFDAIRLTPASVRATLERCLAKSLGPRSGPVRVRVASTFTVRLHPDGRVLSARLDPPLAPELQSCAGTAIAGRFAPGTADFSVPVAFDSGER